MVTKRNQSRTGRNPVRTKNVLTPDHPTGDQGIPASEAMTEVIEVERGRLMDAETILHCVVLAMNEHECEPDEPYFQNAVDVARGLLRRSIDGLDSVRLQSSVATQSTEKRS